jgi:hypothetical protein
MSQHNGIASPPSNGVAKGMAELTHDTMTLAELQLELLGIDCRDGIQRLRFPAVLLLIAAMVVTGSVAIALVACAELLTQTVGLSRATAFAIAAAGGLGVAVTLGLVGRAYLRGVTGIFHRSQDEWARNVDSLRQVLKRPTPNEATQTQDH